MDRVTEHNRNAWDVESAAGESPWVIPVAPSIVAAARRGQWDVYLTPNRPVPKAWFGELDGKTLLGLASGGGQQVPVLAAAGAVVTSFDLSEEQLARDRFVAERDSLDIRYEQGNMANLSRFSEQSFDIVFHPVSNVFAPDIDVVWRECFRILKPGGRLLSAFMNPDFFLFDHDALEAGGALEVRYRLPFASARDLPPDLYEARIDRGAAFEFSHSLDDQLGGQLRAGFVLEGFYEDRWNDDATALNPYMPTTFATLAVRPGNA
jgi:SAM-dependent methyltransferase